MALRAILFWLVPCGFLDGLVETVFSGDTLCFLLDRIKIMERMTAMIKTAATPAIAPIIGPILLLELASLDDSVMGGDGLGDTLTAGD
jgi:hypothetical protein